MTISKRVQHELLQAAPTVRVNSRKRSNCIKDSTREAKAEREAIAAQTKGQAWTAEEHERFLEALQLYPSGPWEAIAEHVGTKNSRQTMTHAQKYRQKFERRQRGLRATTKKTSRNIKSASKTTTTPSALLKSDDPFPTLDVEHLENALMTELFTDFDQLQSIQTWSTNSLFDVTIDELSALPEEFSQSVGLWMA
ncbi:hypothetical protein P43SY_003417 [Pythium insidiosum]|uniref:Myb-like DNA-binding protein n=1 Tax=Pythium insidiosum TaxID=114742 RepID=A0AAD5Q761_PYTIN|nr:hypothetical protein P43SY_003417 [Pythium insidiosum]KAJ0408318.1 hypothetical protein ATCC90586_000059 [Pythium insidiosum]